MGARAGKPVLRRSDGEIAVKREQAVVMIGRHIPAYAYGGGGARTGGESSGSADGVRGLSVKDVGVERARNVSM